MLAALKRRVWEYLHPDDHPRALYVGDGRILAKTHAGPLLVPSTDLSLMPFLALHGTFEDELAHWLAATLRPGDTFVDVGANIGWFTVIGAKAVGSAGRVVAVEADPDNLDLLLDNISMNYVAPWVTTIRAAAWREAGELTFHRSLKFRGNGSVEAPGEAYTERYRSDRIETVTTPAVRLDDVLADQGHIDVLKMDIEGAEPDALEGMSGLLAADRVGTLVLEVTPTNGRASWPRLCDWLLAAALEGWTAADLASGRPIPVRDLVDGCDRPNVALRPPGRQPAPTGRTAAGGQAPAARFAAWTDSALRARRVRRM